MPVETPGARAGVRAALAAFRRLPAPLRRGAVRAATPSYTVGAVLAVVSAGDYLLLRQHHRPDWSLPGGLLERGEHAADGVVREVREELGLAVEVGAPATVVVDPGLRRVDVVYRLEVADRRGVEAGLEPGTEVAGHRWAPASALGPQDEPTRAILRALEAALAPDAGRGRLLG